MVLVHASCVALGGMGVLIRGASGAGKSDLSLRLIDAGAVLVSDDQVELSDAGETLLASPPAHIAGMIEVRGLGIVTMAYEAECPLSLIVDLVAPDAIDRLPERNTVMVLGHQIRQCALAPFEASAPLKVKLAVADACVEPSAIASRAIAS